MELLTLATDILESEITTDENNTMHGVHNGNYEINIICHFLYIHCMHMGIVLQL